MTPPDDLPSPKGLACDSLLKRARAMFDARWWDDGPEAVRETGEALIAALESDRAKLAELTARLLERAHKEPPSGWLRPGEDGYENTPNGARARSESDRALLRRIVEAWDIASNWHRGPALRLLIDEARARIGEGK